MIHICTYVPSIQLEMFHRGQIVSPQESGWSFQKIATHIGHDVLGDASVLLTFIK